MAIAQKKPGLAEYDVLKPKTTVPAPQIPSPTSSATTLNVPQSNPIPTPTQPKPVTTASTSPTLGIPQSNPVPTPPTNYGGKGNPYNEILYSKTQYEGANGNKSLQQWSANNATQYYNALDPTEAAKIKGMNAEQLKAYLNSKNGFSDTTTTETNLAPLTTNVSDPGSFVPPDYSSTPQIPIPSSVAIPPMDMKAIEDYVNQQLLAELTRQRSSADQAINRGKLTSQQQTDAIRQAVERLRGDITERRNIENVENARRLNPFSGRSDYALGMIEMQRGKQDQQISADQLQQESMIQANLAQLQNEINAKYAALEQTQGAERERMIQSIKNDERNYELMLRGELRQDYLANSQLRNTDFNQSLASWQANRGAFENDRNFDYGKYADLVNWTGYIPGYGTNGTSGANGFAANGTGGNGAGSMGMRTLAGQQLDSQNYWNQVGQNNWEKQFDRGVLENDRDYQFRQQQFQEQIRQSGVDAALKRAGLEQDAKQFAASQGLQWAQLSQRDKEFIADQTWKQKNYDLDQAKLNQPGDSSGYIKQIVDMYVAKDPYDGSVKVTNPTAMRNAIIALNLPDAETDRYLIMYGLPTN